MRLDDEDSGDPWAICIFVVVAYTLSILRPFTELNTEHSRM